MVLSNKKLKQKIRAQLAECVAKSESQVNQSNLNDSQTHQSFTSLLNLVTQKPKLSKREKRRVKTPSVQGSSELQNHENGVKERESEEGSGGLEKNKKRKREKDEAEVKDVNDKKSSKKKKKKKNKQKKVAKKEEEGVQIANGGSEEQAVAPAIQTHTSKEDVGTSTKIYVGGIPYYSTVDDIRSYFEGCGSITEIDCLQFPETGKFNGIAMISFRTEAAAKRALALDGSDMGGLSLKIQPYKAIRDKKASDFAPAMLEGYNRIYVGNLSWEMTEDELKKLFSDCRISSIRLGKDKETGEFRGFAHVDFADSLSLTMALKLDQKPLFGRPVRIRCAVPPKSVNPSSKLEPSDAKAKYAPVGDTVVNDDGAKKAKRQTCYDCGEKGHLSSSCPNKKASDVAHTANNVAFDTFASTMAIDKEEVGDVKVKRRTCYECGERGHLSSSCPNKKASDVAHTANDIAFDKTDTFASTVAVDKEEVGDGKVKRRTCYECGERGHLSSSCPTKQAADVARASDLPFASEVVTGNQVVGNNMINSVSDGKLRRRSCYECGERGHLSSACPKKQAAGLSMEVEKAEELKTVEAAGKEVRDNSVSDGKLRRRSCYECGERGHLSSACPKKQETDVLSSSKEANGTKAEELKTVAAVGKEAGNDAVSCVSGGKLRRRTCYECGEKGHLSSLCPNKKEAV